MPRLCRHTATLPVRIRDKNMQMTPWCFLLHPWQTVVIMYKVWLTEKGLSVTLFHGYMCMSVNAGRSSNRLRFPHASGAIWGQKGLFIFYAIIIICYDFIMLFWTSIWSNIFFYGFMENPYMVQNNVKHKYFLTILRFQNNMMKYIKED